MSLLSSSLLNHLPLQELKIELLHQTLRTLKVAFLITLLIAMIALLIVTWTYVPASGKLTDEDEPYYMYYTMAGAIAVAAIARAVR
jgi:hypothetical protein